MCIRDRQSTLNDLCCDAGNSPCVPNHILIIQPPLQTGLLLIWWCWCGNRARPANNTHDASGASKAVSNAAPNPVPVSLPDPAPQRPAKPSTRAVQFVQLDLNPDLGDELGEFVSESSGSDDDSDDE